VKIGIKKIFLKYILKRKYIRSGACKSCGACCTHIYVKHMKGVVKTEKEFETLKRLHPFYTYLKILGSDETGLYFECKHLDKETKKCKIHKIRPGICRRYPQEEIFMLGGTLKEDCGYKFEPVDKFNEVLKNLQKRTKNNIAKKKSANYNELELNKGL